MTPKKVAIYSGVVPTTTFIERLIDGIAAQGHFVYLFGWQQKSILYAKNVKQFTYGNKWHKLYLLFRYTILLFLFFASDKKKLDAIISSKKGNKKNLKVKYYPVLYHRPDIFHLQWAKSIDDWIWVQEFGMKIFLSLRGTHITISPKDDEKLAETYRNYFPKMNGFHAVSKSIALEAQKYGASASKIRVVYSGLPLESFPFVLKSKLNNSLSILSIGRSHWVKGYSYALDACAILQEKNIDFQYTIVGVENDEELLFQRHQLHLENKVTFKKNVVFEEVKKLIQLADVILLPSIEEGIANVVLEAMALGTLVVVTNCGGLAEVIVSGDNGFIVPVRNPEAIANELVQVSKLSLDEYQKITLCARTTLESQHSDIKMIGDMNELYSAVIQFKL